ncbi:MAG: GTPase HflX [Prolixibacteraceae bacterium]|nr:GTPase HflX [Prolixibacteraceae bacterium]MBN2650415.1 GTPase HflX [Prolixibacteraceae bacterium]
MSEDRTIMQETAVLVGLISKEQDEQKAREYIDELEFLAKTAGAKVETKFFQRLEVPNTVTFVGSGKLEEISNYVKVHEVDTLIFDDELTPTQLRNIEKRVECKVLDRTNLILDIFASRAQTAYAKTQVELAQLQYTLPRLTRMWTHLERQKGGIGMRGPGETQIETDRRIILTKISRLKEQLKKIDRQMNTQRKNRGNLVRVALIGYTNVGKSTMMNLLTKSEVFAEDKLFATLDTTVRKMVIGSLPFLLTDTVGFIRKLPHGLVESFKSTLDEVREADILIHIADISHQGFEEQISTVNQTLEEIEASNKPTIYVFNKIDAFSYEEKDEDDLSEKSKKNWTLQEWKNSWMAKNNTPSIFVSAKEKTNIEELKKMLYDQVKEIHVTRFPFNDFLYAPEFDEL